MDLRHRCQEDIDLQTYLDASQGKPGTVCQEDRTRTLTYSVHRAMRICRSDLSWTAHMSDRRKLPTYRYLRDLCEGLKTKQVYCTLHKVLPQRLALAHSHGFSGKKLNTQREPRTDGESKDSYARKHYNTTNQQY